MSVKIETSFMQRGVQRGETSKKGIHTKNEILEKLAKHVFDPGIMIFKAP